MSIFGQVWLWSAAAFVVGVLLTWLFLARPAQARSRHLERRLLDAQNASATPPTRTFEPDPEPVSAPVARKDSGSERLTGEEHHATPSWLERDSLAGRSYEPGSEIDDDSLFDPEPEQDNDGQYQGVAALEPETDPNDNGTPETPAEATTVFDAFGRTGGESGSLFGSGADKPSTGGASLFGSGDEPAAPQVEARQEERPDAPKPERGSLFDPDGPPEPKAPQEQSPFAPFAAPEPPAYAFGGGDEPQGGDEEATETTQVLPRRQPRRSAHAFDGPQPVQPSMRTVERREPTQSEEGGRSGSLFEPTPRAEGEPTPPAREPRETAVPPGPFGPGSAMPRPGGGAPSEEFTVKASVTALRYCTAESPRFPSMVAEVWFRSVEDAERVGFRPL